MIDKANCIYILPVITIDRYPNFKYIISYLANYIRVDIKYG
jgi:hypothetical protein